MKYENLKKWVAVRIAVYLLVLTLVGVGYFLLRQLTEKLTNENNEILVRTGMFSENLNQLKSKAAEITEATKLWQQMPDSKKMGSGLKIDEIKYLIDDYSKRYAIVDMNIDLSAPVEMGGAYKNTNAEVFSSMITLKFGSISDENILSFMAALLQDIPGYTKVQSFKMMRQAVLSESVLADIRKGLRPSLITAELSFQWRDVKTILVDKANKDEKPKVN